MAMKTGARRFSSVAFLTSERYPNLRRGAYGVLDDSHVGAFERLLGADRVLTNPDDVAPYNLDWIKTVCGQSKVVLRPKTTEEVSEIMKICSQNRLAVCPQGGNTGLVGGSVPVFDEVVLSTSLMNKVHKVDGIAGTASCQAGVVLEKLEAALEPEGLMAPYDLGARGSCQVGGNISTCAGGLRLLRYGSMQANTLGIEAVLADGSILNMMNSLKKDNTGYHLRQLFIGSEGTLGIVTQAVLQCPIRPRSVNLALLSLKKFSDVLSTFALAKRCLSETLSSCETMDAPCLISVRDKLGVNCPLPVEPDSFFMVIETHGSREDHDGEKMAAFVQEAMVKGFVLDGITSNEPSRMMKLWQLRERIVEALTKDQILYTYDLTLPLDKFYEAVEVTKRRLESFGSNVQVSGCGHIGKSRKGAYFLSPKHSQTRKSVTKKILPMMQRFNLMKNLWQLRERITESLCKDQYVFKYDITLPLDKFYEAVEVMKRKLEPFGSNVEVTGFGHIGDGNLHLNVTCPEYSEKVYESIEPFLFEWTARIGGSISAEHGMGFKKAKFLKYGKSPEAIQLMRNLKNSMDPQGILNPYKVLPPV